MYPLNSLFMINAWNVTIGKFFLLLFEYLLRIKNESAGKCDENYKKMIVAICVEPMFEIKYNCYLKILSKAAKGLTW